MGNVGFTVTPEQRERMRLAKQVPLYSKCKAGHLQSPGNAHWYESVPYCGACVADGTVKPSTVRWVYFITDGMGHVKIGYTGDVAARLRELQACNAFTLRILGVLSGGHEAEGILHKRFAAHRVRGEWFRLNSEILEFIANIPKPPPDPRPSTPSDAPKKPRARRIPDYVRLQQEAYARQSAPSTPTVPA